MTLVRFRASNHPQQVDARGADTNVDDRATDPEFFESLHIRFGFTVDACALPHNTKLPRFWTPDDDGLQQDWSNERVWCNPPYSEIRPWIVKAWESDAPLIVMLLPANRTEQTWWQELVEPRRDTGPFLGRSLRCEFLPGRIRFIAPGARHVGPNERPPFGCCLLIWQVAR